MAVATRWWSKTLFYGSIVAFVLIAAGALGTRVGIWPFTIGLLMFAIGALLAVIGLIAGLIAAIVVFSRGRVTERNGVLIGVAVCLVVAAFIVPQFKMAFSVPPIHNITTDTADPPAFAAVLPLRGDKSNPVDYDAEKLAPLQEKAYPWVKPLDTPLSPSEAFDRSVDVLNAMHVAIVDANKSNGTIEGTATTFWFGFKDDIVVRIRPEGTGSRIDLHSVSRVGQGDSGLNAKRIGEFLTRFVG
jgi:uncharacterized protein (DUF1499 family)